GNPIQDVVNALGVRFVGDSSACSDLNTDSVSQISRTDLERASAVKKRHLAELRSLPSVIGVGVGASDDDGSQPAIVVYIDQTNGSVVNLPQSIEGVRVKTIFTDPFVAF